MFILDFFNIFKPWGMGAIAVLALLLWVTIRFLNEIKFKKYLTDLGLAKNKKTSFDFIYRDRTVKFISKSWLVNRFKWNVVVVASLIFILSAWRAVSTGLPLELSRSGALVVIAGLLIALIGFWEEDSIRHEWDQIIKWADDEKDQYFIRHLAKEPLFKAKRQATLISFWVSLIGTFIWAFADQILACGFGIGSTIGICTT